MAFASTIYQLKKQYGKPGTLEHRGSSHVDTATGQESVETESENVGTVILLPSRVVAQTFMVFRSKNHPGSAFYNEHRMIALLDRREVSPNCKVDMNDRLILGELTFNVSGILDLHGEHFVELGLSDLNSEGIQ